MSLWQEEFPIPQHCSHVLWCPPWIVYGPLAFMLPIQFLLQLPSLMLLGSIAKILSTSTSKLRLVDASPLEPILPWLVYVCVAPFCLTRPYIDWNKKLPSSLGVLPISPVSLGCIGVCQYPSTMRGSCRTQMGLSKHSSMVNSPCDCSIEITMSKQSTNQF